MENIILWLPALALVGAYAALVRESFRESWRRSVKYGVRAWALVSIATGAVMVSRLWASGSSTAALGLFAVPIGVVVGGVVGFLVGWLIGAMDH